MLRALPVKTELCCSNSTGKSVVCIVSTRSNSDTNCGAYKVIDRRIGETS